MAGGGNSERGVWFWFSTPGPVAARPSNGTKEEVAWKDESSSPIPARLPAGMCLALPGGWGVHRSAAQEMSGGSEDLEALVQKGRLASWAEARRVGAELRGPRKGLQGRRHRFTMRLAKASLRAPHGRSAYSLCT